MNSLKAKWDFDEIDKKIFNDGLKIESIYFNIELDTMIVLLNNKKVILRPISSSERLSKAPLQDLESYQLSRTGVHWPILDEDLSLRGFLKEEMLGILE